MKRTNAPGVQAAQLSGFSEALSQCIQCIHVQKLFPLVLVGLIVILTISYIVYSERLVPPWDPTSMVILAQSLVERQGIQYYDANNTQIGPYFNPHGFNIRSPLDPQPYSTFPPGFSLILAPAYALGGGLSWLYLIPPILGAVGLIATAYLGYVLGGELGSIFAVMLFGTSRVVVTFFTSLWSDGPSLSLLLVGVALYVGATVCSRKSLAFLSGLVLGLFILFKFVNVVFALLIILHQLVFYRGRQRLWIAGLLSVGVLIGVSCLLLYHAWAYGGPLANAYSPWGCSFYEFPLFSLRYLFVKAPLPWNDISSRTIVLGILRDMHIWSGFLLVGLLVDRKSPWRLLLGSIVATNVWLYAVSVFNTRQFINMRYVLPALAAGYLIAAGIMARLISKFRKHSSRVICVGVLGTICIWNLLGICFPDLTTRKKGTENAIRCVMETSAALPDNSVVLAYALADSFILYGNVSVLNYRRILAPDLEIRNRMVVEAVHNLLCNRRRVYLAQDDSRLFGSLYPDLLREFVLQPLDTPINSYEIKARGRQICSSSFDDSSSAAGDY